MRRSHERGSDSEIVSVFAIQSDFPHTTPQRKWFFVFYCFYLEIFTAPGFATVFIFFLLLFLISDIHLCSIWSFLSSLP